MGGSNTVPGFVEGQPGVYGTLYTFAPGNIPGGRQAVASWTDKSGRFWLFGGASPEEGSPESNGVGTLLNDLWEFNPSTNQWAWMGGSNTAGTPDQFGYYGQPGVYGTLGTPAAANVPGGRYGTMSWIDRSGNLWLFGGSGNDANNSYGVLNDLWEFNPSTNQWAWMGGSNTADQYGVYGVIGTPAAGNMPGARTFSSTWIDRSGNFWLFGGTGIDSDHNWSNLNDLWEFNPSTREWTWMNGSNMCCQAGVYGTIGTFAAENIPGARQTATSWTDSNGHLWLFGGSGYGSNYNLSYLNDLWEFNPSTNEWAWISGSSTDGDDTGPSGVYGTLGSPAPANVPGGRFMSVSWTDSSGNLWLFGGDGADAYGNLDYLNDLWEFSPSTNEWTWMGGSNTTDQSGMYGTLEISAPNNIPGSRYSAASWTGSNGSLWLFGGPGLDAAGNFGILNDLWKVTLTTPAVATPTFTPAPGSYTTTQTVTISDATPGATIWYIINGAIPFREYSGAITISSSELLQAYATASGYSTSNVANASYTITHPATATPTFTPKAGTYTTAQIVTISDATPGASIYYTINPTLSGYRVYTGPIAISSTGTLEAFAVASGYSASAVASAAYTIELPAAAPTFTPKAGIYATAQMVTIRDATPGATIWYTINGASPFHGYAGPITVSRSETLEAIATAPGYSNSAMATAAYTIKPAAATPTFTFPMENAVAISDATPGATIYYTTNGTTPTASSTKYTGTITFTAGSTDTLKAIAVAPGYVNSAMATVTFFVQPTT
jgi:N-acetylneuraminic acid mutarotase